MQYKRESTVERSRIGSDTRRLLNKSVDHSPISEEVENMKSGASMDVTLHLNIFIF